MFASILSTLATLASLVSKLASVFQSEQAKQAGVDSERAANEGAALSSVAAANDIETRVDAMPDSAVAGELQQFTRD